MVIRCLALSCSDPLAHEAMKVSKVGPATDFQPPTSLSVTCIAHLLPKSQDFKIVSLLIPYSKFG